MLAREEKMESPALKGQMHKITPIINLEGSDSAMLDNALEFLVMSGMPLPLAMAVTIPEPWANDKYMDRRLKDFFQYYATMLEPVSYTHLQPQRQRHHAQRRRPD